MLKIIHTSDLHIGKRLYQDELYPEQSLFFKWLTRYIDENKVDALLISGDVFDVANPSSESRRIYFEWLRELMVLGCKVIIAGGNHDSAAMLEAPAELLKHLDIHVMGSLPENIEETLVPIKNKQGETGLIIACIPFLRDADLRRYDDSHSHEERTEAVRYGIASVFHQAAVQCQEKHPGIPALAMGHLYVQGGQLSDSERDIQIGNLAGLEAKLLPGYFSYYALGHLHKPQQPGDKFFYSGSPVKLSFSEAGNPSRVMLVTVENGNLQYSSVSVPQHRKLVRMQGTLEQLALKLKSYAPIPDTLPDFIELLATEENHDPAKIRDLEALIEDFEHEHATILKYRIQFANTPPGTAGLYEENQNIAEMNPREVFIKKLDKEGIEETTRQLLLDAFNQIMEDVEHKTKEQQ